MSVKLTFKNVIHQICFSAVQLTPGLLMASWIRLVAYAPGGVLQTASCLRVFFVDSEEFYRLLAHLPSFDHHSLELSRFLTGI